MNLIGSHKVWGGVCVRGGVFGVPPWWLWGVGGGVENTQKTQKSQKYNGGPHDKKISQRSGVGGGWGL